MSPIIHEEFNIRKEVLKFHPIEPKLKGMRGNKPFVHENEIRINVGDEVCLVDEIKFYLKDGKEITKADVALDTELRIAGIIINSKNDILLLKIDKSRKFYCFPGGHVREDESIEQCLKREMKEEINIDISGYTSEVLIEIHEDGFGPEQFFIINIKDDEIIYEDEHHDDQTSKLVVMKIKEMFEIDNIFPKEVVEALKAKFA